MKSQKRLRWLRLLSYGMALLMIIVLFNYDYFLKLNSSQSDLVPVCGVVDVVEDEKAKEGRKLFKILCASCHREKSEPNLLRNINDRYPQNYLVNFITKEDSLLKAKNEDAIQINKEYHNSHMDHNFELTKKQVFKILYYLD